MERFDFCGIEGSEMMISESGHSLFSRFVFIFTIMGKVILSIYVPSCLF